MYDDDQDALAAEYVLGTLSADEREQAEALLAIDPGFADDRARNGSAGSANSMSWSRRSSRRRRSGTRSRREIGDVASERHADAAGRPIPTKLPTAAVGPRRRNRRPVLMHEQEEEDETDAELPLLRRRAFCRRTKHWISSRRALATRRNPCAAAARHRMSSADADVHLFAAPRQALAHSAMAARRAGRAARDLCRACRRSRPGACCRQADAPRPAVARVQGPRTAARQPARRRAAAGADRAGIPAHSRSAQPHLTVRRVSATPEAGRSL